MASRKPRRQNNHNHPSNTNSPRPHPVASYQASPNPNPRHHLAHQPSDYESDYPNYLSDTHQPPPSSMPPLRTNEELNLAVLRRHNPAVTSILSLAQYAVVYLFSPTTRQWEKNGVEGTLFVCQLTPGPLSEDRYSVFVLNRRGLTNFDLPLTDAENVEITDEYIILKTDINPDGTGAANGYNNTTTSPNNNGSSSNGNSGKVGDIRIYGLWIYSEPAPNSTAEARSINAQVIRECAGHAGESMKVAKERLEASRQNGLHVAAAAASVTPAPLEEVQESVPMGRQVSLKDLFGVQRAQDDGWTTRAHQLGPGEWQQQQQQQPQPPGMAGAGPAPTPPQQRQQDVLGDLFRRAGLAYQGGQ
ncbi:PH domain-like protein [Aspergillus heteromorphus CBS 117.55]|uniref:PH domain-like protein n=1 Tax=Aspergillus heteromorphus CBS 117.55 TaxID=1448321 RepID=A0A317VG41_9EURO|nr:PH domain-like protein [Aspergillus heteromorphus CBS 117.55]PWY72905.1 PH domain-like protein [Aspergillus heteromorphus CBS 117.55]